MVSIQINDMIIKILSTLIWYMFSFFLRMRRRKTGRDGATLEPKKAIARELHPKKKNIIDILGPNLNCTQGK